MSDIAFYVHMSDGEYRATGGSIIQYDQVVTNLGDGYDTASGSFTALQHGYYVFTIFFQGVSGYDSDLGIMVNDNMVCAGDAVSDSHNRGTCTAIVELEVGDVVNVKAVYGDVVLREVGEVNGFTGFLYEALWLVSFRTMIQYTSCWLSLFSSNLTLQWYHWHICCFR